MHQKHSKLARPSTGHWSRSEWAILGTTCGNIQSLAQALSAHLSGRWKTAYVDADHKSAEENAPTLPFALHWMDKIGFQRLEVLQTPNAWEQRLLMNDMDVVLVNGNHFEANRQLLALDRRKFDSLSRKLNRLTQVDLLMTKTGDPDFTRPGEMPDFLKEHLPGWANLPVLDMGDPDVIAGFLEKNIRIAPLKALILTGGKSTRMGQDKAEMAYHGHPQWRHLHSLLEKNGLEVYISCREEQAALFAGQQVVTDTFTSLGPFGAILSAFRHDPDAAWVVLACDLPLFDEETLQFLLRHRDSSALATAFRQVAALSGLPDDAAESTGFPEPLVAVWEPRSYARLLNFLAQGVSCPRKVLINSDTHLLDVPRPEALANVNTPEEKALVLEKYLTRS
ncbi:MAG: molybdopterin-guanine dinucleotide biosynthesis protein MobA [Haliscomenobacteraceae bacterium CHB4]|nr:Molybdenum cofactor guanylyltransferase [Saprospiraceae bacterium]MCE7922010.1 molybdopterin-guanine dinucleotide biosynthesis protein MobA [Haliscomenobacteraceae bacterium CHB4]